MKERYQVEIKVSVRDLYPGEERRVIRSGVRIEHPKTGEIRLQKLMVDEARIRMVESLKQRLLRDFDLLFEHSESAEASIGIIRFVLPDGLDPRGFMDEVGRRDESVEEER